MIVGTNDEPRQALTDAFEERGVYEYVANRHHARCLYKTRSTRPSDYAAQNERQHVRQDVFQSRDSVGSRRDDDLVVLMVKLVKAVQISRVHRAMSDPISDRMTGHDVHDGSHLSDRACCEICCNEYVRYWTNEEIVHQVHDPTHDE